MVFKYRNALDLFYSSFNDYYLEIYLRKWRKNRLDENTPYNPINLDSQNLTPILVVQQMHRGGSSNQSKKLLRRRRFVFATDDESHNIIVLLSRFSQQQSGESFIHKVESGAYTSTGFQRLEHIFSFFVF